MKHKIRGLSTRDVLKVFKMAIAPVIFPETSLTEDLVGAIQSMILHELLLNRRTPYPNFIIHTFRKNPSWSHAWNHMRSLTSLWKKLKVDLAKVVLRTVKVWVPKPLAKLPLNQVLQMVEIQSNGLPKQGWTVFNRKLVQTLVIVVEKALLKALQAVGYKVHLGFSKVVFRIISTLWKDESSLSQPSSH